MNIRKIIKQASLDGFTDKATAHSYDEFYPDLFKKFKDEISILEIGVAIGGGLKILSEVFPNSKIYGIDISYGQLNRSIVGDNVVLLGPYDQSDSRCLDELPMLDIIIDDASHEYSKSIESFELFSKKLNSGGIYVIEDVYPHFLSLYEADERFVIFDLRHVKGRQDDVLAVYTQP